MAAASSVPGAATLARHSHFLGHSSNVNCLRFGRKSGQVAATGGDDHMVNLWRMRERETKNIMSLAGHQSPVECLVFDPTERKVVAGSKAGSIKAFDLEAGKVSRTLKGHMSTCTTVDYHLYGDYVASGALDTIVKVWDLRTKSCMQTFKGHKSEVTKVCFTPDGRWLTSGSMDGSIRIWDLTAGRMLREFPDHGGAITALEFNPEEFILVSSSADRTLRIWDVQEFSLIGVTPTDSATTTALCHTVSEPYSGKYLISSSSDAVRVWSYETAMECHDSVPCHRPKDVAAGETQADVAMLEDMKVMGGTIQDAFVSIWLLDLSHAGAELPREVVTTDYIMELRCGMDTCVKTFRARQKCMQQLLGYWEKGQLHDGFRYLAQLPTGKREAIVVDMLRMTDLSSLGVDLEGCVLLLPLVVELFTSRFEGYLSVAIDAGHSLLRAFGPVVKDARDAHQFQSRGVNLAGEERQQRCSACDTHFHEMQRHVRGLETSNPYASLQMKLQALGQSLSEFCRRFERRRRAAAAATQPSTASLSSSVSGAGPSAAAGSSSAAAAAQGDGPRRRLVRQVKLHVHGHEFQNGDELVLNPEYFPELKELPLDRMVVEIFHSTEAERVREENALAADPTAPFPASTLAEAHRHLLLELRESCATPIKGKLQVSVLKDTAAVFQLAPFHDVTLRFIDKSQLELSFVEISVKDQFLSRRDLWYLTQALIGTALYVGKSVRVHGARWQVLDLRAHGDIVRSGVVSSRTKFTFRSRTSRVMWLVQMSPEMWDMANSGQLYLEILLQVVQNVLHKWIKHKVSHSLTIMLFSRCYYPELDTNDVGFAALSTPPRLPTRASTSTSTRPINRLPPPRPPSRRGADSNGATSSSYQFADKGDESFAIGVDEDGRHYQDFYKIVAFDSAVADVPQLLVKLKQEMNEFPHLCGWRSPLSPPSSMTPLKLRFPDEDPSPPPVGERRRRRRGVPSNARDSNLLEAINLVLNIFEKHHIDRHLSRSGQSVVILTAGNGIFSVNKRLAEITEQRMMDHGIGIDMISLATPPLHKCPLFLFKQTDAAAPSRGAGVAQAPPCAEPAGDGVGAGNGTGAGEVMDDLFTSHAYIYKQLTSNQRRWSQVRPRDDKNPYRLVQGVLKWKSLIFPALLPLTTDYIPGQKELKAHYTESFYSFTLPDRDDPMMLHHGSTSPDVASAFRDYREYVMEMVAQRFSQDFQLVTIEKEEAAPTVAASAVPAIGTTARAGLVGASDASILTTTASIVPGELPRGPTVSRSKGKPNGSVFWLSMGHRIHEIMYNEETQQVEVKRYHQRATARSDVDIMEYRYALWSPVADDFLFASQEFRKYPRIEYAWNMLDVLICGEQDSMIEGIRYKRIMHCIVPPLLHKDVDERPDLQAQNAQALQQYTERCRKFFEFLRSKAEHPSAFPDILLSTELAEGQRAFGTGAFHQVVPYNIKIPLHSSDAPTRQNWVIVRVDTELLAAQCFHVEVQWMVCHSTLVDDFITTIVRRAKQLGLDFIAVPENGVSSDLDLHPLICPIFVPVRAASAQRIVEEALVHRFGFCAEGLHAIPHSHLNHSHEYAIVQQRRPRASSLLQQQLAPRGSPPGHGSTSAAPPGPTSRLHVGGEHPYRRQTNYYRQYIHRSLACFVRVTQTGLVWISNRKLQCQVIQPIYVALRELVNAVQSSQSILDDVLGNVVVSVGRHQGSAGAARRRLDMEAMAEPSPPAEPADVGEEAKTVQANLACDMAAGPSESPPAQDALAEAQERQEQEVEGEKDVDKDEEEESPCPPQQDERLSGDSDKENDAAGASQNAPASAHSTNLSAAGAAELEEPGCAHPATASGAGSAAAAPPPTPNLSSSTSSSSLLKDPLSARSIAASHHASTRQQLPFPQPM
ncbi:hypothetical protein ATCC90586_003049 [Pythium insidiosum]|nr:hypothetical protein ATCC90586_003049 [Pythium insidiosum]